MTPITDKDIAAWMMRKDTEISKHWTYELASHWCASTDVEFSVIERAASKFAAIRKAIRAERKQKGGVR